MFVTNSRSSGVSIDVVFNLGIVVCVLVEQGCGGNPAGLVDGCAVGFNETLNLGNVSQDQLGFAKAELERPFGVGGGFKDKHGVALKDVDFGGGRRRSGGRFGFQFHFVCMV
jgi:hypothetical protein